MKLSHVQYARALYEALSETRDADSEKVLNKFVEILKENGHLGMWDEIEAEFLRLESRQRGEIPAVATIARDGMMEKQLFDDLNKITGKKLSIKQRLDSRVVGGIIIETEDLRIDASLKKQLNNLKNNLADSNQ
ncbi:MAG: F0F1 ATP synthase subunit delta [Patescibacteria group bacterium]